MINEKYKIAVVILVMFIFSGCIYLLDAVIYNIYHGTRLGLVELISRWDTGWYYRIATEGYTSLKEVMTEEIQQRPWVFPPLYPMSVRILHYILPMISVTMCGVIISNICIFVATYYAILFAKIKGLEINEKILIFLMFVGPYTLYFNIMYTEAMFVMLLVLFFYHSEKNNYLYAGFCSALASATRVVGILLVFALLGKIISRENGTWAIKIKKSIVRIFREPLLMLSILLCPLGLFIYCLFLYFRVGDPLAFMHGQIGWGRNDRSIFESFYYALSGQEGITKIYLAICAIGAVGLCVYLLYRKLYIESITSLIMMYIPLRSSVGCAPRYAMGSFFPILAASMIISKLKHKVTRYLVLVLGVIWEIILIYCWYSGYMFMI